MRFRAEDPDGVTVGVAIRQMVESIASRARKGADEESVGRDPFSNFVFVKLERGDKGVRVCVN